MKKFLMLFFLGLSFLFPILSMEVKVENQAENKKSIIVYLFHKNGEISVFNNQASVSDPSSQIDLETSQRFLSKVQEVAVSKDLDLLAKDNLKVGTVFIGVEIPDESDAEKIATLICKRVKEYLRVLPKTLINFGGIMQGPIANYREPPYRGTVNWLPE